MALDKEEAKMLADAIVAVNAHYNTMVDARTLAWINLGGVAAAIYGPRAFMLRARFQAAKKERARAGNTDYDPASTNIMPMTGMGMTG